MSLQNLLLRIVVDADYQTKGATLSWEELDANFQLLADAIREIGSINPGGIDAYSPAVEYSLGDLVTHQNNLWEYIYPTPSTGNAPALDSAYWAIRSAGTLSHKQNTDTHTTANRFGIGDGLVAGDKEIFVRNGAAENSEPRLRYKEASGLWEISHNGADFAPLNSSPAFPTVLNGIGEIDLNFKGFPDVVFDTNDPIAAETTFVITNDTNAVKATWIFTIANLSAINFPANVLTNDARVNALKWTPFDNGIYKAAFTKRGANWLLDYIDGPYS